MNTLSLIIYLASVVDGLRGVFGMIAILIVFGTVIACVAASVGPTFYSWDSDEAKENKRTTHSAVKRWVFRLPFIALIAGLFAIAIPSSDTVYLIAASEAGEAVVTSPEARELMNDLHDLLRSKIADQVGSLIDT